MRRSTSYAGVVAIVVGIMLSFGSFVFAQADPFMGTWELNAQKSTFETGGGPGVRKRTLVIAAKGDMISHVQDSFRVGQDAVVKVLLEAKYDGKDYPVTGAAFDTVAFTRTGNKLERVAKNRGMQVETATYTVAPNGKTMTVVTKGDNYGVMYGSTQIFEKQ